MCLDLLYLGVFIVLFQIKIFKKKQCSLSTEVHLVHLVSTAIFLFNVSLKFRIHEIIFIVSLKFRIHEIYFHCFIQIWDS